MINCLLIYGHNGTFTINSKDLGNTYILDLKRKIHKKTGIPYYLQSLRYGGYILMDNKKLSYYKGIKNGSVLDLNGKLLGGGKKKLRKPKTSNRNKRKRKLIRKVKNTKQPLANDLSDDELNDNDMEEFIIGGGGDPFKGIGKVFKPIGDVFKQIPKFFKWLGAMISWIFTDLLNPIVWIRDAVDGIFVGLKIVIFSLLDGSISLIRYVVNSIFEPISKGIWGELPKETKCYKTNNCGVPYSILFATLIMPPLGIFMELGIKGWVNILICSILTLFYYVPGLIYGLVILYC